MLYLDVTRLYNSQNLSHMTGVDKVTLAYIRYLGKDSCAVIRYPKYWLFLPYDLSQAFFTSFLIGKKKRLPTNVWSKKINTIRYGKPQSDQQNFLIHTSHGGLEKPDFLRFMANYQLKGIYFLHDLIPIDYPEYCRDGEKQKHQLRLNTMSQGQLVICNSYYTLSRWQNYCQTYGLNLPTSIYAHLAPDDIWNQKNSQLSSLLQVLLPDQPYFLVVGTIESRKNHLLLLNVWRELYRELQQDCPKLVIVGKRGWECEQVLDVLDRSDELRPVILELNECSDEDLNYLMHHCQALLFSSYEEGYGLPLIEAFISQIPVIASKIPAFEEINLNNIAQLISPTDTVKWKKAILDYLTEQNRLIQIQEMAKIRDELPSWSKHFEVVIPHLTKLLQEET